ncbi:MAG: malto-oligosyltrehalose trehalohydrolase [Thermoplasmata archaeon]
MVADRGEPRTAGGGVPEDPREELRLGAFPYLRGGVQFRVWAPRARAVRVSLTGASRSTFDLFPEERGYFSAVVPSAHPGDRYRFRLGGRRFPDPASRSQPDGLSGPSEVVDPGAFDWSDSTWRPPPLPRSVLYELHVGTFTESGTLDSAIPRLARLAELGITTVELLPVSEERADTGWGYGPVFSFAVRRSYGGAPALQRFVDAAHGIGLAVVLDIVFNHWSGEAAFLERFGPYFHPRATTPWGPTPNFEGPGSDEVRRYFFECARAWLRDFHIDGFRLDAVHEVRDRPGPPFWAELSQVVRSEEARQAKPSCLIGESDLNDVRILRPVSDGGWGLDAQWADDFHSALHAALTGERQGYYADFGPLESLARAFEKPLLLQGGYSVFHGRRYGAPIGNVDPERFVVFDQNHDQVGNRGDGARLTTLLPGELPHVALALLLWSASVPMLFMGEEYGETRPFYFFTDPSLRSGARVQGGRNRELRARGYRRMPPNPSLRSTFDRSHLDWSEAESPRGRAFGRLVATLVALRRDLPALRPGGRVEARAWEDARLLSVHRETPQGAAVLLANVGEKPARFPSVHWAGRWTERMRSGSTPDLAGPPVEWSPASETSPLLGGRSFLILAREDRPSRSE